MQYIIDRMEQEMVICEDENGSLVTFLAENMPKEAREGDVLVKINGSYSIDKEETRRRRQRLREKLNRLKE